MNDKENEINWNEKLEDYFASTGEKAHCLGWIHKKSEAYYSNISTFIDLPVIVISTLIGASSIGSRSLFGESEIAPIVLGIMSIFVSLLNTLGTYFSWTRRAESHRISNIQYSRMYRNISVEMSLPRNERTKPSELLRHVRIEYDRLNEISPLIPPKIIKMFNDKFSKEKDISQPEEVNGLERIEIYVPNKLEALIQTEEEKNSSVQVESAVNIELPLPFQEPSKKKVRVGK